MNILESTVGDIAAGNPRAAAVFERFHIDFCCNGHRTLAEACAGVADPAVVETALREQPAETGAQDYRGWPVDLLADVIEKKYHRETTRQIDLIKTNLDKICRVHGATHPEMFEIKELFEASAGDLTMHMKKEELVLFPFIRKMVQQDKPPVAVFGTVDNPIRALIHEHQVEGERFREIAALSDNFTAPADGCQTYRLTFQMLKEFEEFLHIHIHLENNLLFPQALAMASIPLS